MTCRYFLLICGLPFYSVGSVFWCTTFFHFDEVQFICFFPFVAVLWGHISEKPLLMSKSWRFNLYKLQCLYLALWPILSWFLYTVWGKVLSIYVAYGYLVVPAAFVEIALLCLLNCFDAFVTDQLIVNVRNLFLEILWFQFCWDGGGNTFLSLPLITTKNSEQNT